MVLDSNTDPEVVQYFDQREYNNARFWGRIGHKPDLTDKHVMDFGCSIGGLTIGLAEAGAKRVVGLDIDKGPIEFAKKHLELNYPQFVDNVEYVAQDINDYAEAEAFDYIVTRNTFEHVIHLEEAVAAIKKRLKVGGKLYAGFGPLYNSPFGDHGLTKTTIPWGPWGHVLLSEQRIVKSYNQRFNANITSVQDLGVNTYAFSEYERILKNSGLKILSYRLNQPKNDTLIMRTFAMGLSILRELPFLKEYCTFNIYCIMEKEG